MSAESFRVRGAHIDGYVQDGIFPFLSETGFLFIRPVGDFRLIKFVCGYFAERTYYERDLRKGVHGS